MKNNILDLTQFKNKKELERFTVALFQQCLILRQNIKDLEERVEHLKQLLDQALLSWDDKIE